MADSSRKIWLILAMVPLLAAGARAQLLEGDEPPQRDDPYSPENNRKWLQKRIDIYNKQRDIERELEGDYQTAMKLIEWQTLDPKWREGRREIPVRLPPWDERHPERSALQQKLLASTDADERKKLQELLDHRTAQGRRIGIIEEERMERVKGTGWLEDVLGDLPHLSATEKQRHRDMWEAVQAAIVEVSGGDLSTRGVITHDEERQTVIEPQNPPEAIDRDKIADIWEENAEDFDYIIHEIFHINKGDLRLPMEPVEIVYPDVINPDRVKFMIPYILTNSTNRTLPLGLRVWIVTSDLLFTPETGGWLHRKMLEHSALEFLSSGFPADWHNSMALIGRRSGGKLVGTFRPGETKRGVAIFPRFDQEMDKMRVVFEGLTNAFKYNEKIKRVLVFHYERPGDEFHPHREKLRFVKKDWEWMWMWYSDTSVSQPERVEIETPTGQRKAMWHFNWTLHNSTRMPQTIDIRSVSQIVNVNLDVDGMQLEDVEVELVDIGEWTIYKTQVAEENGLEGEGMKIGRRRHFGGEIEPQDSKVQTVIFEEDDIRWDALFTRVEDLLNIRTGRPEHAEREKKLLGIDYLERTLKMRDPATRDRKGLFVTKEDVARRRKTLTAAERDQIREQVRKAVPELLSGVEKSKKRVRLNITAWAGVGSGTFQVTRFYIIPGEIKEEWNRALEDWVGGWELDDE